jgi:DNA-directed RNA polymerase subunit omega
MRKIFLVFSMARVTIEDCTELLESKFALVALAATRAKEINKGNMILVDRDNDKDSVVALREIAAKKISVSKLEEAFISTLRKNQPIDDFDARKLDKTNELEEMHTEESESIFDSEAVSVENYVFSDDVTDED